MSRTSLAVKSSMMGISSKLILVAMNFICRFFFVRFIGVEILGLEGVIKDCVSLLSMTDLGISTAMTYRLYGVINNREYDKASRMLALYKKAYRYIMLAIAIIGVACAFLLRYIITDVTLSWMYIYIVYFLQIIMVEASYLAAYKRCLLNADQKYYIQIEYDTIIAIIATIMKIIVIVGLRNYILYIVVSIVQNLLSNILLNRYIKKHYSLYEDKSNKIDGGQLKDLFNDTKNIIGNKICGFIYSSTDNVLISTFLGTAFVGYLSNYKLIFSTLNTLLLSFTTPITTLVGSYLNSEESNNSSYDILEKYSFARYIVAMAFMVPVAVIGQDFMIMYAGQDWLLPEVNLILLICDFYISCIYGALGDYSAGLGIFSNQKKVSLAGAIINISLSVFLLKSIGISGVLVGTVVSQVVLWVGNWIIVHKELWNERKVSFIYWSRQLKYISIAIIDVFIIKIIIGNIYIYNSLLTMLLKIIIAELITLIIVLMTHYKSSELIYYKNLIKNIIRRRENG